MSDLLSIGVSGLQAFKRELDTTSHNIANVNTEGYSRQRVDLAARAPERYGFGYMGTGVGVDNVKRIVDEFLDKQILTNSTSMSQIDTFHNLVSRVDELLANPDAGLTATLQSFFNAAQDVANDPTSIPARQVFLARAETLVDSLNGLDQQLASLAHQTNGSIANHLEQVNSLAEGIALLNRDITTAYGGMNRAPNDLLDKRDQMIRDLSQLVEVQLIPQDNGAMNVFIGSGQALVVDSEARTLEAVNNRFDPQQLDIAIRQGSSSVVITDQMRGGAIGGSMDFLNQVLYPARNELGRIAVGLAGSFNEQHRQGLDLDGELGGDFFQALNTGNLSPAVLDGVNNSSSGFDVLSARYGDVSQLGNSNYQVRYIGGNQYEVLQTTTNQLRTFTGPNFAFDGLEIEISSAPSVGDTFLVRPGYGAASNLELAINDPRAIAAGLPVLGATAAAGNGGGATIAMAAATDGTAYVAGDYSILFGPADAYQVLDSDSNLVASGTFNGDPIAFNGLVATFTGTPMAGDSFSITGNQGGVGDNRNMLALAGLQTKGTLDRGNASYLDVYGRMVANVGAKSQQASITRDAQATLLQQSVSARESVSGVNLDEEAAALIRFQQAYQAAAQVISVANELFQTLLGAVRR
jgi:flagellar hook-associated protein 1 FlgK